MASNHGNETIKLEQRDSGDPLQQLEYKVIHNRCTEFVSNSLADWLTQNFSLNKHKQCESFLCTAQIKQPINYLF